MRLRHKPWAGELLSKHPDVALNIDSLPSLKPFDVLEIGSGCGGFLIKMALNNPQRQFLGVEVAGTAYAIAVKKLVSLENPPQNIRFLNAPEEKLMDFIKDGSLKAVYLNFSDPWPKKRHHKRRLTYPSRLKEYYRILEDGGKVAFKTDNVALYEDSKKYFTQFGLFQASFIDDYDKEEEDDEMSEYEEKFRLKGVKIHRIVGIKEKQAENGI